VVVNGAFTVEIRKRASGVCVRACVRACRQDEEVQYECLRAQRERAFARKNMSKHIFIEHLHNLAKIASIRKQKMVSILFYGAMKKLKDFDDSANPVTKTSDLEGKVKGFGPYILKHLEKRELSRLGLAPPPDPVKVAAKAAKRSQRKLAREAAASSTATAADDMKVATKNAVVTKNTVKRQETDNGRRLTVDGARAMLEKKPFFLDVETNGILKTSEIIELAVVDHQGVVLIDSLVRPLGRMSSRAQAVHGINANSIAKAPLWIDFWNEKVCFLFQECARSDNCPRSHRRNTYCRTTLHWEHLMLRSIDVYCFKVPSITAVQRRCLPEQDSFV
jgi:hypothetical protein